MTSPARRLAFGAVVLGAYVAASAMTHQPVRPLFDGIAPPQPYRWVNPPSQFAKANKPPKPFATDVDLSKTGSVGASVATDDGQCSLILPADSFPTARGARAIHFRIVPKDPSKLRRPLGGAPLQGNAYAITARYVPTGGAAEVKQPITVLVRYPAHATELWRLSTSTWTKLAATPLPQTLQIYANTRLLGTFVAAGGGSNRVILWYITGGASALAAAFGLVLGLRERRRGPRKNRPRKKRTN